MGPKGPQDDVDEFLAAKPTWLRKVLQLDFSLTSAEESALLQADLFEEYGKAKDEYEAILQRVPAKWREYRKKVARNALSQLPSGRPGRRRKDAEAEELKRLHPDKSYAEIAIERLIGTSALGPEATPEQRELAISKEKERIRSLLRSRRRSSVPRSKYNP